MAKNIKTVVVLVQENRSFDHMLGWMQALNQEIDGVIGNREYSNPLSTADTSSTKIYFGNNSVYVDPDPGHSIQAIYEQIYGVKYVDGQTPITPPGIAEPPMNGFAQEAASEKPGTSEAVMNGFKPDAVPVYKELVKEFAVCDKWFASVPASTQPNRLYVHSATSHGLTSNNTKILMKGMPQKTIFEELDEAGYTFGIYFQSIPSTLFYRNLRKLKYVKNFHPFDLTFKEHCKKGKLPNYVVIEQRFWDLHIVPANDDHPSHDVSEGQNFVKEVYEALRSSPQWQDMLFVITYDEHGGFYDHVPTPVGVPSPDGIVGNNFNFQFDRLGIRVPTFFISPWVEPGTVLHRPSGPEETSQFEHSSIPATLKKIFNLKNFLTKRDAWAGTFESVLSRTTPRPDCPETLPLATKLRERGAMEEAPISDFQTELVQLAAVLNGDHTKEIYPNKLVKGMTVVEAAQYASDAYAKFRGECDRCIQAGMDESHIPILEPKGPEDQPRRSQVWKLFACFGCGHGVDGN
ncbi:Non-specific phospholipase C4 [Rhynchospora pubera]|uniref:Non-specific phospholipase C4 n=1 Tax=Rhynchospora pubera TaxID=906938 RepID=A0AAV8F420_9POAL|nr:Non-specific phospholipase C4 [Rhynchospora pubera]